MIIELLQAIPRIDEPLPEPGEESSLPSSLSRGEVSAMGILELRRSSPLPPPMWHTSLHSLRSSSMPGVIQKSSILPLCTATAC